MTGPAWGALAVAAVAAVANWIAVARGDRRAEYVAKPLTTAALAAVALLLDPEHDARRAWFVAAVVLSLAGDVFLMLPADRFVAGLASFLLAHVAYLVGFWVDDAPEQVPLGIGVVLVAVVVALVAMPILRALRAGGNQALAGPVVAYMVVLGAMTATATGSGIALAVAGGWLFLASDGVLAWNRFVRPFGAARVVVMVTYHLAQAGLVLSLAS